MVQKRPRYMVGCTPRVNGNCPGKPIDAGGSSGESSGGIGIWDEVSNSAFRSAPGLAAALP